VSEPSSGARREDPVLYFDLASPYSYLAVMRAQRVLGCEPRLQPVLAGAIFAHRGWGSWALTSEREANVKEIERRAAAYRLPLSWPKGWPENSLTAQRAAIFACQMDRGRVFAEAVYLATYGHGGQLREPRTLLDAGLRAGIAEDDLAAAVADPQIKSALRQATDQAIAIGVMGVPTLQAAGELCFGDDQLELAVDLLQKLSL
jgi:2-hydroxychromene-2-carboxylate isomerase